MPRDYYEVLGRRAARRATTRSRRRSARLARELHPDINRHDPAAEEKFKEVAEAYEVLSDARAPRASTTATATRACARGGYEPNFARLRQHLRHLRGVLRRRRPFGSVFGGRGAPGPSAGADVAVEVELTLEEVADRRRRRRSRSRSPRPCSRCNGNGAEPGTPIETCPRCEGTGQLQAVARTRVRPARAHAGLRPLRRRRARSRRRPARCAAARGHELQAERRSRSTSRRASRTASGSGSPGAATPARAAGRRATSTCSCTSSRIRASSATATTSSRALDVPFTDAALGATLTVPTLDGDEQIELDAGTQPATVLRLRGRGLPALRGPRPRRPARGRQRDGPEQPDRRAARAAAAVRGVRERRDLPGRRAASGLFDRIRHAFRG